MTVAEQIMAHMFGEHSHETWIGKHYPPCPGCGASRWHHAGCTLDALLDEHREAVDVLYMALS